MVLPGKDMSSIQEIKKKVVMVGDPAVGKTSLINRFVSSVFGDEYLSTIGTKITKKIVRVQNKNRKKGIFGFKGPEHYELNMSIWDVAGQKTFIKIADSYYRGAKGALVVCDLTRRESLDNLPKLIADVKRVAGPIPIVVCGNKSDLAGQLKFGSTEIARTALPHGATYYLTSAKTGANVERAFKDLAQAMVKDAE